MIYIYNDVFEWFSVFLLTRLFGTESPSHDPLAAYTHASTVIVFFSHV